MKIILQDNHKYVFRFDPGDEVIEELKKFAERQGIGAAFLYGIGAARDVVISYYDLDQKEYRDQNLKARLEIISLLGSISKFKNETIVHAHGCFADRNYQTHAGHVKKLIVSATCEILLNILEGKINRELDKKTGLNLME